MPKKNITSTEAEQMNNIEWLKAIKPVPWRKYAVDYVWSINLNGVVWVGASDCKMLTILSPESMGIDVSAVPELPRKHFNTIQNILTIESILGIGTVSGTKLIKFIGSPFFVQDNIVKSPYIYDDDIDDDISNENLDPSFGLVGVRNYLETINSNYMLLLRKMLIRSMY